MNCFSALKDAHRMLEETVEVEKSVSSQRVSASVSETVRSDPSSFSSSSTTFALPCFLPVGSRAYPEPLLEHLRKASAFSMLGVFPSLSRVWCSVDNKLLLWDFRTKDDCWVFDEIPDVIISVGSPVVPVDGVLQSSISYLLPVATSSMVMLLGVMVSESKAQDVKLINIGYCVEAKAIISRIAVLQSRRRIFCAGLDGNIYEVSYQKSFLSIQPKVTLIPQTSLLAGIPLVSSLTGALDSVKKFFSGRKPAIRDISVSEHAELLFSLDDLGRIHAYSISVEGLVYRTTVCHRGSLQGASDRKAPSLVRIFVIDPDQEDCNLVAISLNGEQLRYHYGTVFNDRMELSFRSHIPSLFPPQHEVSMCAGTGSSVVIAHRDKLLNENCEEEVIAFQAAFHAIKPHHQFRDVATVLDRTSFASHFGNLEAVEVAPDFAGEQQCSGLCTQVFKHAKHLFFVHRNGIALCMICRPIDTLRLILNREPGVKDALLERFVSSFNPTDYACMLLQLAIGTVFAMDKRYSTFHMDSLDSFFDGNRNSLTLQSLGRQVRDEFSFHERQVAKNLLRDVAIPQFQDHPATYGQKNVIVRLSPLGSGVMTFLSRVLFPIWSSPFSTVSVSACENIKTVLMQLIRFLESLEVGQRAMDPSLQIQYPVRWGRTRIVVNVPENISFSLSDAYKLQLVMLHCCYLFVGRAIQAVHLLSQWSSTLSFLGGPEATPFNQILLDAKEAEKIGASVSSKLLSGTGVIMVNGDPLKIISTLKKDCPYFFESVDISDYQVKCEIKQFFRDDHVGFLTETHWREWVAQLAPKAAQYWLSSSLPQVVEKLCSAGKGDLAVKLLLHAAQQLDPDQHLMTIYSAERGGKNSVRETTNPNAYSIYQEKIKVLEKVVAVLEDSWFRSPDIIQKLLGIPPNSTGIVWDIEPGDEMGHFYLFEWLAAPRKDMNIRNALKNMLVCARSPHLIKFLTLNAAYLGEDYVHFLRCSQRRTEAVQQGVLLAQASLTHLPLEERLGYRVRCLGEALECAKDSGSDQVDMIEKRFRLLQAQRRLLQVINKFSVSSYFQESRLWNLDGRQVSEGFLVKEHRSSVSGNILSTTELLRIAAMYPLFGGAEIQLDVIQCSDAVVGAPTYAACVAQAYEAKGFTIQEISKRLLDKYYIPSINFPLAYIIRMLEADEYKRSPQGSNCVVLFLLNCNIDAIVLYNSYKSIVSGTDAVGVVCKLFETNNVTKAYLLYSLAVVAVKATFCDVSPLSHEEPLRSPIVEDAYKLLQDSLQQPSLPPDDRKALKKALDVICIPSGNG